MTAETGNLSAVTAPDSAPPPAVHPGRVLAAVSKHVKHITRFDDSDLLETEPEQFFDVPLELTLSQHVSFEIKESTGPNHLPAGITKLGNEFFYSIELRLSLSRANELAPKALKRWADSSLGSYRRLMPAGAAFFTDPGAVGYEHTCATCKGCRQISCSSCDGAGSNGCYRCSGSGKIICDKCNGILTMSCSNCHGSGRRYEYVFHSYDNDHRFEQVICSRCTGTGSIFCNGCGYSGMIGCSKCDESGKIRCAICNASGKVDCSSCQASGVRHTSGTVIASVQREEVLLYSTQEDAIKRLIHDKLGRNDLPALGELLDVQHSVSSTSITTHHRLRLDVYRAKISARAHDFVVHGFGPEPSVYSFENIAGHLLADDLKSLETCISKAGRWRRQSNDELLDTTADFLRSELNILIIEKVADLKSTPQKAALEVENHFKGLVDTDYVARATTALRNALARLYSYELIKPAAYLCGTCGIVAGLLFTFGWPQPDPWFAALSSLVAAGLAWGVLEWLTRRRIGRRLKSDLAPRVLGQLHANGSVWRWRIGVGLAATLTISLAILITGLLPITRNYQAAQRELTQAKLVLSQWVHQAQPDFRLRNYPVRSVLEQEAAKGDARAQLVLAWKLLLGADASPKDVEAAGKWLNKAASQTRSDPIWQAAKAVYVLNQEPLPETIQLAAQELDHAADQGLVEARYWEARIYLTDRSPVFDLQRGLILLTQAADQNHAHAALYLGKRLAARQGSRRNVSRARHYLQIAANAGLPQAQKALNNLR